MDAKKKLEDAAAQVRRPAGASVPSVDTRAEGARIWAQAQATLRQVNASAIISIVDICASQIGRDMAADLALEVAVERAILVLGRARARQRIDELLGDN